jgi:acyl-CoA dehydrogenase
MTFPEAVGGVGLGFAELGIVLEECGRTLAPTPIVSTVVLAGGAISLGGTDAQRARWLPGVCAGERVLALAHDEGTRHARHRVATRAEPVAGGFRITGEKSFVLDGHGADALVVVARVAGASADRAGIGLFIVPAGSPGLTVARTPLVDSRNAARVRLDGVVVPDDQVLGAPDGGAAVLDRVLDRGAIAVSAEMLGGALEAFERTVAYLKTRRQFGVLIGSFQALKHRAAQMFCEVELSRSIVLAALRALDDDGPDAALLAAAAKARTTDTFLRVAGEAIQMHGGIGVTDELDIGLFYKRARVAAMTLGDAAYQRDRYARLQGY